MTGFKSTREMRAAIKGNTGLNASALGALQTAAASVTALGTTTVTAISATATSAVATANAADQSAIYVEADVDSIATLANALKVQLNINATENADLRARQAQNKTAIDALKVTVDALVTQLNAQAAAIDALVTTS